MSFTALLVAAAVALPFKDRPREAAGSAPDGVDVEERLNQPIPASLVFTDSTGAEVSLSELLGGEVPVVLTLAYYRCPALCNLVLAGTARALRESGLEMGKDYRVVTVSIDPSEGPREAKERRRGYLQAMGLSDQTSDWPFLTGDEPSIRELAEAVGFRYRYDAELKQFAHAAVAMVLTPDGRVSRYFYGIAYPPRDLRLSLVEAAGGRVGTTFDRVLLTCFQYDPVSRRYGWAVKTFLRVGSLLIFGGLAGLLAVLWRRELRGRARR